MLPGLEHVARGKVREIFAFDRFLLIVTTDRLSAFDVVMANGIPFKAACPTSGSGYSTCPIMWSRARWRRCRRASDDTRTYCATARCW
jgi:hypothetical protein